ncbi:MAG: FeoB-associated Cys-rich membrane protein [Coriobacteriales bacterium]|nr:FeoB-associated Cys-rich membrane protein [Coriobacteriales bacterium]
MSDTNKKVNDMNLGTIAVILVLAVLVAAIIRYLLRQRKAGGSSCAQCRGSQCRGYSACHGAASLTPDTNDLQPTRCADSKPRPSVNHSLDTLSHSVSASATSLGGKPPAAST